MHSVTSARGDPSRLEIEACRDSKLPEKYIPELKEAASAAGIKWEDFTVTDNTCPAKPMTKNLAAILGEDIDLVGLSLTLPSGPHIAAGWRHQFPFAPSTCTAYMRVDAPESHLSDAHHWFPCFGVCTSGA